MRNSVIAPKPTHEQCDVVDLSFGALREVEIDVDRADGQRGVHLDRISHL
ncbi:MAG: hypothetical protein ACRDUV_23600 [Pseudonocardiaceae bacterium]